MRHRRGPRPTNPGKVAEDCLAAVLVSIGINFERQAVIGYTIYHRKHHVDFFVRNLLEFPAGLVIESKWQASDGSIDEKFPYVFENIQHSRVPTIVVVHGGGCHPGAMQWLRERIDGKLLVAVFGLEQFMSWIQRTPKAPSISSLPLMSVEPTAERRPD